MKSLCLRENFWLLAKSQTVQSITKSHFGLFLNSETASLIEANNSDATTLFQLIMMSLPLIIPDNDISQILKCLPSSVVIIWSDHFILEI
jgi:hypothetical protein